MWAANKRNLGERFGAVAAALLVLAAAVAAPSGSRAQNAPDPRAHKEKKAPPPAKGAVVPRRGPIAVPGSGPSRFVVPHNPALGPASLPGSRITPVNPAAIPAAKAGNVPPIATKGGTQINPVNPTALPGVKAGTAPQIATKGGPQINPVNPTALPAAKAGTAPQTATKGGPPALNPAGQTIPGTKDLRGAALSAKAPNGPISRPVNVVPGPRLGSVGPGSRGFTNRDPRLRVVNAATPRERQVQRFTHRADMLALRARIPRFPLPGERNFTGVPPVTETRFLSTEMVCQWGPDMTQQGIEAIARQHNLAIVGIQRSTLTGGTLVHFRIAGNRAARDVVRAMEAERIISQPNYVYDAVQDPAAAQSGEASGEQYVANKLRLAEVHKIATGKDVIVAVIDSQIDNEHPELAKGIAEKFDAVGQPDKPDTHGTGMAGAIVAQDRLMGIAPGARALAVHAFATGGRQQSPQATTQSIIAGLDWALAKGARIVNMSFAGPQDPMLALALKRASEKGAVLIAAVGNAGPKSPPLYPAADPHVIGVTATDETDQLYKGANRGAQVAVAAPGVDVMVPAPAGTYQLTTGTSVAAAHVSGVAALLLERHPEVDATTILEVLTSSATRLGSANKRDDQFGWGLIDPLAALAELDARVIDVKVAAPAAPPAPDVRAATTAAVPPPPPAKASTPATAASRPALPRPGIYVPKQ